MQGQPKKIHGYVLSFCDSIVAGVVPMYLDIVPSDKDEPLECTKNVERKIKECGGRQILGWKIWEWYGLMLEAEFHAVWESPEGHLVDITPIQPCVVTDQILFLKDDTLVYEGKQINNIRSPLKDNREVKEFIATQDQLFELMNRGDRALENKQVLFSPEEACEYHSLMSKNQALALQIEGSKPDRNDFCRCGSGLKAKRCHYK